MSEKSIEQLRAQLREAEIAYIEAQQRAEQMHRDAEWADQRRVDCGQRIGKIRAAIEKAEKTTAGELAS
jgi:hypothetical protein